MMIHVELTTSEIKIAPLYQKLIDPKFGGINVFCGTIREWTGDVHTKKIRYTAYEEMALSELRKMANDVANKYDANVVIVHRLGLLELTDVAVFVGVATGHRAESYGASRYIIERLKEKVPIWKEEFDTDKTRWGGIRDDDN